MTQADTHDAQVPEHFELGKQMAKLTIEDHEDAVVLLRPRYEMKPERLRAVIRGIEEWKKSNKVAMRVLIVPHDFDVFAMEVQRDDAGEPTAKVTEATDQPS